MHPTRIYYLFSILLGFASLLSATTYIPFVLGLGFSLSDIALLNAGFFSMIVLAEIPTGMLADGKSRAWSIRTGIVCYGLAMAMYACAVGFWTALFAELMAGIASAFLSGTQQAWLKDALKQRGELDRLSHSYGTASFLKVLGGAIGGACGAGIGIINLRLPYALSAVVFIGVFFFMHKYLGELGEPLRRVSEREALRMSLDALRASPSLRWVAVTGMCFGLILPFNHYWAPYFRNIIGVGGTGLIWIPMYLATAMAALLIRKRGVKQGTEAVWLMVALVMSGIGLAVMSLAPVATLCIGFVFVHEFGRGLIDPVTDYYVQHRVESHYSATYGSLHSFLGRFGYAVVLIVVWAFTRGMPATSDSISRIWLVAGLLLVMSAVPLWLLRPRG